MTDLEGGFLDEKQTSMAHQPLFFEGSSRELTTEQKTASKKRRQEVRRNIFMIVRGVCILKKPI